MCEGVGMTGGAGSTGLKFTLTVSADPCDAPQEVGRHVVTVFHVRKTSAGVSWPWDRELVSTWIWNEAFLL